jgi:restriction system protein
VPAIPGWAKDWGGLVLVPGGFLLLLVSITIGVDDGTGWGWTLTLAVAAAAAAIWLWDYRRRLRKRAERRDRELYELSEFTVVDQMRGHPDFELYCTGILPGMGYTNVEWIGRGGDGGMDILAVDPDGNRVGVQCKRLSKAVGPELFRTMAGTVTAGRHAGRRPVLMTNARVTDDGWAAAEELGIQVIDRARLGQAMWELRSRARAVGAIPEGHRANDAFEYPPTGPGAAVPQRMPTGARIMLGVVACAALTVIVVLVHASTAGPRPVPTASPHATSHAAGVPSPSAVAHVSRQEPPPGPAEVVREFVAAINRRDWRQVWDLGGKNLGRGLYASYAGMISGYQGTIRDVLTEIHASGDTVTGQFLAYQTGNVVQPYRFKYTVRGAVILSGYQHADVPAESAARRGHDLTVAAPCVAGLASGGFVLGDGGSPSPAAFHRSTPALAYSPIIPAQGPARVTKIRLICSTATASPAINSGVQNGHICAVVRLDQESGTSSCAG